MLIDASVQRGSRTLRPALLLRSQVVALNRCRLKIFFDYGGVVQAEVSAYRLLSFSVLSTGEFVNVAGHCVDPCFGKNPSTSSFGGWIAAF